MNKAKDQPQYVKDREGNFKCPYYKNCVKKYKSVDIDNVYKHVSRKHQKQKMIKISNYQHMCSCNKRYKYRKDLNKHQRAKDHNDAIYHGIYGDVKIHDIWWELRNLILQLNGGRLFDVVMCDPPHPDTCLNLPYNTMSEEQILSMPVELIQERGFFFLWTTNAKRQMCEKFLEGRGYKIATYLEWFKTDNGETLIHGIGGYFSHCVEECIIGVKGDIKYLEERFNLQRVKNGILDYRRQTSQKPVQIYEMIEKLSPYGWLLDIFGTFINRRHRWVFLGNESDRMKREKK
ncbi:MT-A70 family protein [Oxytricha trifallax]|uniref:mRNA m(6)A methyltransferase n=1 Tax=Oxytricha trifallax TaxID=1172189 RepID=A0A073I063_9SPIT|nr:MT-A70 family protein [Oxytricha trifallax]